MMPCSLLFLLLFLPFISCEYCGNNRIPYGLEVHKDGHLTLLCSRPNCHEKKYAECTERPDATSCESNSSWVGGLMKTVDDKLYLQCCEYDLLPIYGRLQFKDVVVREGEFYEGEEKMDANDEDVVAFDLITNIQNGHDDKGKFYNLTIFRYYCDNIPPSPPLWFKENQWPFWPDDFKRKRY